MRTIDLGGGIFTCLAENYTLKTGNLVNSYATYADESDATTAGISSETTYKYKKEPIKNRFFFIHCLNFSISTF
jgi:hypothetical protein